MQRNIFQKCNTLFLVNSIEQSTCNEPPPPSNVMTLALENFENGNQSINFYFKSNC